MCFAGVYDKVLDSIGHAPLFKIKFHIYLLLNYFATFLIKCVYD